MSVLAKQYREKQINSVKKKQLLLYSFSIYLECKYKNGLGLALTPLGMDTGSGKSLILLYFECTFNLYLVTLYCIVCLQLTLTSFGHVFAAYSSS